MKRSTKLLVTVATAVSTVAFAGVGWAFWTTTGTGSASSRARALAAPVITTVTATGSTVSLFWTPVSAPNGVTNDLGYWVQSSKNGATYADACASTHALPLKPSTTSNCNDTGLTTGSYTYTVTAVFKSWTALSAASPSVNVAASTVDHFAVAPSTTTPTAGTAFSATITAKDASNNTVASYTGSHTIAWSGAATSPAPSSTVPSYPTTTVAFTNGVSTTTLTATLFSVAGPNVLTATETSATLTGSSASITVSQGTAHHFAVTAPTSGTAGTAITGISVTARDQWDNTATSYAPGNHTIAWSGAATSPAGNAPTYPTVTVSFTNGVSTTALSATLFSVGGPNVLTASATSPTLTGSSASITVTALAASRLAWTHVAVSAGTLSSPCIFVCTDTKLGNSGTFTANVSVTDTYGNTVSGLGTGHTVTVTRGGDGGAFTAPGTPGAATFITLTVASTGPAESTVQFTFTTQSGSWNSDSLTAATLAGTTYTDATATVTKN